MSFSFTYKRLPLGRGKLKLFKFKEYKRFDEKFIQDITGLSYKTPTFLVRQNLATLKLRLQNVCRSYNPTSIINKPIGYKNPDRPSCVDLILTNGPRSFQNSCVISDFHKMVETVMTTTYRKLEPRIVFYRDFKYFCNNGFKESLQKAISQNLGVGRDEI